MKRKMYEKPSVEVVVLKQAGMLKYTKGESLLCISRCGEKELCSCIKKDFRFCFIFINLISENYEKSKH